MAKTKAQLRTENNANFPNNNSQFITPEKLRNYNGDVIDAFATETDPNFYGTGSFTNLSGSGYVSASEFIGDGSKLTGVSSTVPAGTVSGSSQIILQDTTGDLSGSRIDGPVSDAVTAVSASYSSTSEWTGLIGTPSGIVSGSSQVSDLTGSLLTTASNDFSEITFTKGDSSTFVIDTTPRRVIESVKNKNGFMAKGTPVYVSGSTGNELHVYLADAGDVNRIPATFILDQDLDPDESGFGILSGFINGVDTSLFAEGANIYLAVGGGYTDVQPTGSAYVQKLGNVVKSALNGSGVISGAGRVNALPNLPNGYIWSGDSNGVPQAYSSSSLNFALTNVNNTFTGTQSFNNISVSGTGSFGYIESVTGSAKIIGDAFIILNNDTPTERYAGIKVIDSGSSQATASLQFDGQTNDWFYEYTASGDPENFGVVLFGPEYNTIGSPTYNTSNTIPKSDGGHHLNDSSITDDGTTVETTNTLNVQNNSGVTLQNQSGTGEVRITPGPDFVTKFDGAVLEGVDNIGANQLSGSTHQIGYTSNDIRIKNLDSTGSPSIDLGFGLLDSDYSLRINSGSNLSEFRGAAVITGSYTSTGYNLETSRLLLTGSNTAVSAERPQFRIVAPNNSNDENQISIFANNTSAQMYALSYKNGVLKNYAQILANNSDNTYLYLNQPTTSSAFFQLPSSGDFAQGSLMQLNSVNGGINNTSYTGIKTDGTIETQMSAMGGTNYIKSNVNGDLSGVSIELNDGNNAYNSMWAQTLFQMKNTNIGGIGISPNISQTGVSGYAGPGIYGIVDDSTVYEVARLQDSGSFTDGTIDFQVPLYVSPSSTFSGSAQFNSNATFNSTSTFIGESTHNGGLVTSGSIKSEVKTTSISSLTASIDFSDTSMFELTLGSGVDTHIDATNIGKGQTVNLLITQDASSAGTVSFSPKFLQPTGSEYVATATLGAQDILTLVTFSDTTKIYVANVKELS